jgi:hypothetical protein
MIGLYIPSLRNPIGLAPLLRANSRLKFTTKNSEEKIHLNFTLIQEIFFPKGKNKRLNTFLVVSLFSLSQSHGFTSFSLSISYIFLLVGWLSEIPKVSSLFSCDASNKEQNKTMDVPHIERTM